MVLGNLALKSLLQPAFEDFTGWRAWHFIQQHDNFWHFVGRQMGGAEGLDAVAVYGCVGGHRGYGYLAKLCMRPAEYCRLAHCRISEENVFDFNGIEFYAVKIDEIIGAALEEDVAVFVYRRQIYGIKPAATKSTRIRLRIVEIPGCGTSRASAKQAGFARRLGLVAFYIDNFRFDSPGTGRPTVPG